MDAKIETTNNGELAFYSDYDRVLVAKLKTLIPYQDRRWDRKNRRWLVAPRWGKDLAKLVFAEFGIMLNVPNAEPGQRDPETRLLKVEYLGTCKQRDDGTVSAYGFVGGTWAAIFPVDVLRGWFEFGKGQPTSGTLYATLGIKKTASADDIKRGFRRMAKQWHPDVCSEPNAAAMFRRIHNAYQVLSDDDKRDRYDAGLTLQASLTQHKPKFNVEYYRAPLRCGWILTMGLAQLGRFIVSRILQWEDIMDAQGRTMVTSWPSGADKFAVKWV
jgi:hypothetical protein